MTKTKETKKIKKVKYLKCHPERCVFSTVPDNDTVYCTAAYKCGTTNYTDK